MTVRHFSTQHLKLDKDSAILNLHAGDNVLEKVVYEMELQIKNADGLHMRPAMQFVDIANRFESDISVSNNETTVDGKSIMQMTMLAATYGTKLAVRAEGPDAKEAVDALRELIEVRMFDEPPPPGQKQ